MALSMGSSLIVEVETDYGEGCMTEEYHTRIQ